MTTSAKASLVQGEYVMTAEDFRRITTMLHADSGIVMTEGKATLVYSRLAKRLRNLGLESFRSYCALVSSEEGMDERQRMLSALTTNLTKFFREPHHFEDLKAKVMPGLIDRARRGGRVRLWSAGCSNGAEPYSIGLTLLSVMPDALNYDVKILATDIDYRMVQFARDGVYEGSSAQGLPPALCERWMIKAGRRDQPTWAAGEELRELISFRELNLLDTWPMQNGFDVIFCRNVCIYFDEPTQNGLWVRFADRLERAGSLYIGHSERLGAEASRKLRNDGVTTYRLGGPER